MELLALSGFTGCFSRAGLAEGTNANTFQIAAPNGAGVDFAIDGVGYHKADTDNIAFSSGHTALGNSQHCVFLVQINAALTVSTKQGNIVADADLGVTDNCQIPLPDEDMCPLGYIKVETSDSGTFTPGSTDLGDAEVTDSYVNFLGGIPSKPVSA